MIKKVLITAIHPEDDYYGEDVVGKIVTIDVEDHEYIKGWKASRHNESIIENRGFSEREFYAIKFEEIS